MAKTPKPLELDQEQLSIWSSRITRAYLARAEKAERWDVINEYIQGRYFDDHVDTDRVAASWHLILRRQMLSGLYFTDPRMNFQGRTTRGNNQALVMEQVMQYVRNRIDISFEERKAIKHGLDYGLGIVKYGWNAEFGEDIPLADNTSKRMRGVQDSNTAHEEDQKLKSGALTEHDPSIQAGMPWAKHIPTRDFLIDPEARTLNDARWFAHRFSRPWIEAVNDSRWDDAARKALRNTGESQFSQDEHGEQRESSESVARADSSLVVFYEIFDRTTQTMIVISDATNRALSVKPFPYFGRQGPYAFYPPIELDDSPWGLSWTDTFTPQALAVNKLMTKAMEHYQRLGIHKGIYNSSLINEDDMRRFSDADLGEYVPSVAPPTQDIRKAIYDKPPVQLNPDTWGLIELFKNNLQEVSGVTENAMGGGRGVQTATEANIIQQQVSQRQGDMRIAVDRFIRDSSRNLMTLLRQFWTSAQVIPITGPNGRIVDMPVDSDLINGEYDVDIEVGSTERVDRTAMLRQGIELLQMLTQMAPVLAQQGKVIDLSEIVKRILRQSEIVKNPDRIVVDLPPQPPQPGQPQPGGQQNAQNQPSPSSVNGMGQVLGSRESDVRGRLNSEAAQ